MKIRQLNRSLVLRRRCSLELSLTAIPVRADGIIDQYWSARTFSQNAIISRNLPGTISDTPLKKRGCNPLPGNSELVRIDNQRLTPTDLLTRRTDEIGTAFAIDPVWKLQTINPEPLR